MRSRKMRRAYSLIELSLVILIIGIIIAGVTQSTSLVSAFRLEIARNATSNSPVPKKNLVMWLETTSENSFLESEADSDNAVSIWKDINPIRTVKYNATQSTADYQPLYKSDCINGLPCLRFDGSNDFFDYDGSFLISSSFTIFVVEQRRNTGHPSDGSNFFIGGINETEDGLLHLGYRTNTQITFAQYLDDVNVTVGGFSSPVPKIHSIISDLSSGKRYYLNGVNIIDNDNTTALSSYTNAKICKYGNSPSVYFTGDLGEIIMYDRALTNKERRDIEAYLAKKWGLKL